MQTSIYKPFCLSGLGRPWLPVSMSNVWLVGNGDTYQHIKPLQPSVPPQRHPPRFVKGPLASPRQKHHQSTCSEGGGCIPQYGLETSQHE